MDANRAFEVVRDVGYWTLAGYDGCHCSSCSIQGVTIEISCRKSNGMQLPFEPDFYGTLIRVYTTHCDHDSKAFSLIAEEIIRQIAPMDDVRVRYCDYLSDKENKCSYCGAKRENPISIYCDEHKDIEASL